MRVIIIDKTYLDSERVKGPFALINQLMPDEYPLSCREIEANSIGEVKLANPGKTVMTAAAYNAFHLALEVSHSDKIELMLLKEKELNIEAALETGNV